MDFVNQLFSRSYKLKKNYKNISHYYNDKLTVGSQSAQCQEYPLFFGVFFNGGIKQ